MVDMTRNYPVGSLWSAFQGDKCIVLAHDFTTDQLLAYNYRTTKECWISASEQEDKIAFRDSWSNTVAFEKGVFTGLSVNFISDVESAFAAVVNEQGPPMAGYRFMKGADQHAEAYNEYLLTEELRCVDPVSLRGAMASLVKKVRFDVEINKITKIVWRVHPEAHLRHDEITGNRFFNLYARFVAFSHDECITPDKFQGCVKRNS